MLQRLLKDIVYLGGSVVIVKIAAGIGSEGMPLGWSYIHHFRDRFGESLRPARGYGNPRARLVLAAFAPIVAIPVFIRLGLYRSVIRYLPEAAIWTIVRAMLIATMIWVIIIFLMRWLDRALSHAPFPSSISYSARS
jgi:hypothetical protein